MLAKKNIALVALAGVAALGLGACSAGQISQTSSQVAAVDGASGNTEDNTLAVRDVAVVVDGTNTAALRFTAVNNEVGQVSHTLQSVTVDGSPVTLNGSTSLDRGCSIVADSSAALSDLTESEDACISHLATSLSNTGFAAGGTKQVQFKFDGNHSITVDAAIVAPTLDAGKENRQVGTSHEDNKAGH
ncbi:MAG: hypothetical protein Q3962_06405 [Corynebacterium sp.]|nr:hypothetical protein [Corynebacterium sp.]